MSENDTICQTVNGEIIKCSCCYNVFLKFKTYIWNFSPESFSSFKLIVQSLYDAKIDGLSLENSELRFTLSNLLSLSIEDLEEIIGLLEDSEIGIKRLSLEKLFNT